MENSSKVFPSQSLTAVPPGCVADSLWCRSHLPVPAAPLPTRAPMPWHPSRDGDAPAHPKFTAWATGGPQHPFLEPLLPSHPDGATLSHRYQWENLYIYPFQTLSPPALWPSLTPSSASLQWESIKK